MRYLNTTPLQLGMTGEFLGKRYRIAGRSVMGMDEGGETYTWDEFNLVADDGSHATLVHEVTERGVEWRMFSLIEPTNPLNLEEAASRRVGEFIDLTGKPMRITCVDESRVLHIEGEGPEGEDVGDVAHYFNAECGNEMVVVSWTGDEVECYRGVTLPPHVVTNAFGLTNVPISAVSPVSGTGRGFTVDWKLLTIGLTLIIVVAVLWGFDRFHINASSVPKLPKTKLAVGKSGELKGTHYRITGRAAMEIARVGERVLRHEYVLSGDANEALLAQGPSENEWVLLTPVQPARLLSAQQLAALRLGDPIEFDGTFAHVREMTLTRVRSIEGSTPFVVGTPLYGVVARDQNQTFMVRWNETGVTFYRVTLLTATGVGAAFK